MAEAIHVPRINNNDDEVKLVGLVVDIGSHVTKGQVVAQVETDKAVVDVEAGTDGFVLAILGNLEERVKVGHVLIWLGQTRDAAVPDSGVLENRSASLGSAPTAKAKALLHEYGLDPTVVLASGERLSVADIERYLVVSRQAAKSNAGPSLAAERMPEMPGELKALRSEDRGMLATVLWHRDVAVPGYVELTYDPASWDAFALEFGRRNALMVSPLLPLMAWRLVELARDNPRLNATIVGPHRYEYNEVNLGSTAQVGEVLYPTVVRDAARLGEVGFVHAMVDVQRRAASHKLGAQETHGTTIGFSSMARWKVARHIPILSPQTSLMVAHTVGVDGMGVLGATYDHRVMSGSDVASTLGKLAKPGPGHG